MEPSRSIPTAESDALNRDLDLLRSIQTALAEGDIETIRQSADALRGSITSLLARHAFEAALALENSAREEDLSKAQDACRRLRAALNSFSPSGADQTKERAEPASVPSH
jgi:hypothetical protein